MFKTIDGQLTTIFSKVQNVNGGFNLTSDAIGDIVDSFNELNSKQDFGNNWANFLDGIKNENVADLFKDLAKQGASAKASVEDVYAAILNGNTRGIGNVKSIISIFNSLDKDKQEALAKAVGQTNAQFGKYLGSVKDGKARLGGYAKQLVATTAKTIGLQLATIALNLAVSAVIGAVMWGVSKVINQMSDLKAEIDNLKSELDDTRSEIEDINSTLDENKKKIEEINQNPLDITNKETLTTLQLENVELERQKKLLEEIEKQKAKELNDTTVEYLNKKSELNTDGGYWKSVWNNIINPDSIVDDFKQIFDKNTTWGEKILNVGKFINPFGNVVDTFLPETRSILDETEAFQNELDGKFREIEAIFSNGISADTDFNAFSTVTADINELRDKLTVNIDTLNTYKDSLSETSDEYKTVSEQLEKYLSQLETLQAIESYDTSGLTEDYFKIKEKFDNGFNAILASTNGINVDESLTKLMNIKTDPSTGNQYYSLAGNYLKQFEQAEKLLNQFDKIELTRELTFDEQNIKRSVESYYEALNKEIQKYGETYASGKNSEASIIFSNYLKDNSIENISEETYSAWKNGLLKQANGDTEITDTLLRMVSAVTPQIENVIDEKKYNTTTSAVNDLSNSFVTLRESINKTSETKNAFDSALKTIKDGGSLSYDDVWALVDVDNSLADKFTRTADGYTIALDELNEAKEKYNETNVALIQDEIDSARTLKSTAQHNIDTFTQMKEKLLSNGINSSSDVDLLNKYNQLIDEETNNLNKANTTLSESNLLLQEYYNQNSDVTEIVKTYTEMLDDLEDKQSLLSTIYKEQNDDGQISLSTYQKLVEAGEDYANCVEIIDGKIVANLNDIRELTKTKYADEIATLELAMAEEQYNAAVAGASHGDISPYVARVNALNEQIKNKRKMLDLYEKYDYTDDTDTNKDAFDKLYSKWNHDLEMHRVTQEEYINWLDGAYKQYFSDLTKYEDEYNKYEAEVYKARLDREQDLFDKKIENYKKLSDNALNKYVDSDGNELTVNARFDYAREQIYSAIEETQNRINELSLKTGFEDEIEELKSDLEDLNDTIVEINKKEFEYQKDYIETLKNEYSDLMDEQIDQQKKLADEIEKSYESQIDIIDKQIDAINKVNEAEERQKKILEAQKDVKEAQKALDEASIKNRVVLTDYGWEARADEEAIKEAQEDLAEKQEALDKAYQDEQIAKLEEQKELLETQRDNSKEYYDKVVEDLENQKTEREKQYDILVDIYEQLGGEKKQTTFNDSLVDKLTKNGDINKAVQGLSPTELQQAFTSGLLTTDSNGNYAIDYSILDENEQAVKDNTDALEKANAELEKLNNQFNDNTTSPKSNLDSNGYLVGSDGKQILHDGKPIKATTKSEWEKKHTTDEWAPNGKNVEKMTMEEYYKKSSENEQGNLLKNTGKFAGYNTMDDLIFAIMKGEYNISNAVANSFMNNNVRNRIPTELSGLASMSNIITNTNSLPAFHCEISIAGNADEKTVELLSDKMDDKFIEYTNTLTRVVQSSFMKQKYK